MTTHTLKGTASTLQVELDGRKLDIEKSWLYRDHSKEFNWGYGGSGPSQLALAVVVEVTGVSDGYQEFKWQVISKLRQGEDFEITFNSEEIK